MKKIITLIIVSLVLVSCAINCDSKPPKRAIMHATGAMGMQYHFTLYEPVEGSSHGGSFKCPKIEYLPSQVYTDDLGTVSRNNLVWISYYNEEIPFDENMRQNTSFTFTKREVTIKGLTQDFKDLNGVYKIEETSPDSWGVPIANSVEFKDEDK